MNRRCLGTLVAVAFAAGCGTAPSAPPASVAVPATSVSAPSPTPATSTPPIASTSTPPVLPGEPWIVYMGATPAGNDSIFLMRPDGSDRHVVATGLPGLNQQHPDWSPDGTRIAFKADDTSNYRIWVMEADGSNVRELATAPDAYKELPWWDFPAWSPDGTKVVAVAYDHEPTVAVSRRSALILTDVATGASEIIAELPAASHQLFSYPRWSPTGDALVVSIGQFDPAGKVWLGEALAVLRRSGSSWSAPEVITPFKAFATYPDWHRSRDLIVYATHDWCGFSCLIANGVVTSAVGDVQQDLFTVHPDGSGSTKVTHTVPGTDWASHPSWTPDGRILFAYHALPGEPANAAFIAADGSGLTALPGLVTHPRMRPARTVNGARLAAREAPAPPRLPPGCESEPHTSRDRSVRPTARRRVPPGPSPRVHRREADRLRERVVGAERFERSTS